jgi:hypothetical protein
MTQPHKVCAKCSGAMEEGYSIDSSHGVTFPVFWFRGKPTPSSLSPSIRVPLKKAPWYSLSRQFDGLPVTIWRCQECGYLEHYADGRSEES